MAWDYAAQIHALTGFDADDIEGESETGDTYSVLANRWLTDAAKEVINILPPKLKMKCAKITNLYIGNTDTTMVMDGIGSILHVTRENADSGYYIGCREIPSILADSASDSSSLHYATSTDPVYWVESNSESVSTLFVRPTPTATQPAKINHISYPLINNGASAIANFPDEAEHLVVLRAAITAAEYKLSFEEDIELYVPIIASLKLQYEQAVLALQTGKLYTPKKKDKDDS